MARRVVEKVKGVYEHPEGSGVWWINYYAQGQRGTGRKQGTEAMPSRYIRSVRQTPEGN